MNIKGEKINKMHRENSSLNGEILFQAESKAGEENPKEK